MKTAPKIKLSQIATLLQCLTGLDGRQRIIKDANGAETSVFEAFDYSIKVTWNRVKNIGLLERKAKDLEKQRDELRKKHGAVGSGEVPKATRQAFIDDWVKTLELEEELTGGLTFSVADLNLYDPKENPTGNKIPGSVLAALMPFIA